MTAPLIACYRRDLYSSPNRTYVVLGAPRGGTSMVAGALQLLGVPMGSVNDQHEDPTFHDEGNVEGMIEAIGERNAAHARWGWKLPNTIYYYGKISAFVRNPVFLVAYRNPLEIFVSAAAKSADRTLTEAHFNAPIYHYAKMHQMIHDHPNVPTYAVSYEAACAEPDQFVGELAGLVGLRPSPMTIAACRRFIDPARGYAEVRARGGVMERLLALVGR